jgi:hypothetical protein
MEGGRWEMGKELRYGKIGGFLCQLHMLFKHKSESWIVVVKLFT